MHFVSISQVSLNERACRACRACHSVDQRLLLRCARMVSMLLICRWCCCYYAVARAIDSEFLTAAGILEKLAKIQKLIVFFLMYFV
jgi:hypothetical protein